jgi:hypothetical protein
MICAGARPATISQNAQSRFVGDMRPSIGCYYLGTSSARVDRFSITRQHLP